MKRFSAVRWAVFLITVMATADAAAADRLVGRSPDGLPAKCERCGQTGPTVPIAPIAFRARPAGGVALVPRPGDTDQDAAVRPGRPAPPLAVRDEFTLDSPGPAVGAVLTR